MPDVPCEKFSATLNSIVRELLDRNINKNTIPQDVIFLKETVVTKLKQNNVVLNHGIMGSTTESLRMISKTEYELHINLKLPFELTPIRDDDRPGFVLLKATEELEHPAIVDGYLDQKAIKNWIYDSLKTIIFYNNFDSLKKEIEFKKFYRVVVPECSFKLTCLPVLEFNYSKWPLSAPDLTERNLISYPWYAVPQVNALIDQRSFLAWSPDWERCIMEMNPHYKKVELLIISLLSNHDVTCPNLKYVIQTTMVHATLNQIIPSDLGDFLIFIIESLASHLKQDKLNPFFESSFNLFRCVSAVEINYFYDVATDLIVNLNQCKSQALAEENNQVVTPATSNANWVPNLHKLFEL
ncbi:uncharacterized protein LOC108048122 [Drosophila rhopaloa]|uniref:Uncharacterized protein n=1 Tax=Drosophila rhopaloa TaxID=1041015 RepID=A0ABM5HQX2_DRORH|nr:uncharacterized protein LOC108048122 [Drosophila rhopaloa]